MFALSPGGEHKVRPYAPGRRRELGAGWALVILGLALARCGGRAAPKTAVPPVEADACLRVYVIYSTSCTQCRYVKPVTLRVAEELRGLVRVSPVLAESTEGADIRRRYGVRGLPAVVATDATGATVGAPRYGVLTESSLRALIEEAAQRAGCGG